MSAPVLPKLRKDLVVSKTQIDAQTFYTIKDGVTGRYFRIRELEYWLIQQFDGQTTLDTVSQRVQQRFGVALDAGDVAKFVELLESYFFLENTRSEQELSRLATAAERERPLVEKLLFVKIKAYQPGRFLEWLSRLYRPFHRPFWLGVALAAMTLGLGLFVSNYSHFNLRFSELFASQSLLSIFLAIFIVVGLHEFAHAVVCRYYGGQVREIGFLLLYLQPCFYCDVSDAWLFPEKSRRMAVTFAGPFCQLLIMAGALLMWRVTVESSFISELSRSVVLISWLNFFINFNPLLKLDGYYLLSDWLEIPNLRSKAFRYLKNTFQRHVLGWPIESYELTARERRTFIWYGVFSLLFSCLFIGYMLWLIGGVVFSTWGRTGLVLYVVTVGVILRKVFGALGRGLVSHVTYMKNLLRQPFRLTAYLVIVIVVFVGTFTVWFPHRVSGDILVEPLNEFSVSLNSLALLEQSLRLGGGEPQVKSNYLRMHSSDMAALELVPVVRDKQEVSAGDTIAILTSNQVTSQVSQAQAELSRLEGQLALLKAPPKKEQIAEARTQVRAARAEFSQLERDYSRINELVARGHESKSRLESASSALEIARARLANREEALNLLLSPPRPEEEAVIVSQISRQQAQLNYLTRQAEAQVIISPIAGIAQTHSGNGEILTVTSRAKVELKVPVADFDLPLISVGQTVHVKVRSYPNRLFEGTVERIPEEAERGDDGLYFPVTVLVDNGEGLLREGMSGYAKIEIGRQSLASLGWRKLARTVRVEFWSWW